MTPNELKTQIRAIIYPNTSNLIDAQKHQDLECKIVDFIMEQQGIANTGLLGSIAHNASAPTPGKNGYYIFSSAGTCSILAGSPSVNIDDELVVKYTAPSTYEYSLIPVGSRFVAQAADSRLKKTKVIGSATPSATDWADVVNYDDCEFWDSALSINRPGLLPTPESGASASYKIMIFGEGDDKCAFIKTGRDLYHCKITAFTDGTDATKLANLSDVLSKHTAVNLTGASWTLATNFNSFAEGIYLVQATSTTTNIPTGLPVPTSGSLYYWVEIKNTVGSTRFGVIVPLVSGAYKSYLWDITANTVAGVAKDSEVAALFDSSKIEQIVVKSISDNIVNLYDSIANTVIGTDGSLISNSNYDTTGLIELNTAITNYFRGVTNTVARHWAFYTSSGAFISYVDNAGYSVSSILPAAIPATTKYIRFAYPKAETMPCFGASQTAVAFVPGALSYKGQTVKVQELFSPKSSNPGSASDSLQTKAQVEALIEAVRVTLATSISGKQDAQAGFGLIANSSKAMLAIQEYQFKQANNLISGLTLLAESTNLVASASSAIMSVDSAGEINSGTSIDDSTPAKGTAQFAVPKNTTSLIIGNTTNSFFSGSLTAADVATLSRVELKGGKYSLIDIFNTVSNIFGTHSWYNDTRARLSEFSYTLNGTVINVSPGANALTAAVAAASTGDTIQLADGIYNIASETQFGYALIGQDGVSKVIKIKGNAANPSAVVINDNATGSYGLRLRNCSEIILQDLKLKSSRSSSIIYLDPNYSIRKVRLDNVVLDVTFHLIGGSIGTNPYIIDIVNSTFVNVDRFINEYSRTNTSDSVLIKNCKCSQTTNKSAVYFPSKYVGKVTLYDNDLSLGFNSTILNIGADTAVPDATMSQIDVRNNKIYYTNGAYGHGFLMGRGSRDIYTVNNYVYVPPINNSLAMGIAMKTIATAPVSGVYSAIIKGNWILAPRCLTIKGCKYNEIDGNTLISNDVDNWYAISVNNPVNSDGEILTEYNKLTNNTIIGGTNAIASYGSGASESEEATMLRSWIVDNNRYYSHTSGKWLNNRAFSTASSFWSGSTNPTNDANSSLISGTLCKVII